MKKILSGLLACTMAVSMAACSRTPAEDSGSGSPSENTGGTSISLSAGKDPHEAPIKVAFCAAQMDANPVNWKNGQEEVFSAYPNVTYTLFDAGSSAETQSQQVTEVINQGYDALIVQAVDSASLAASVTEAEEAGINVVCINLAPDCVISGRVGLDSYNSGYMVANHAAAITGGTGRCVALSCPVALSSVLFGTQGFKETLENDYPGMEFLEAQPGDWTTENANEIMRNFLTKYNNDIQVVFCENDQMAFGVSQAVEAAGLTGKVLIYGCDGLDEAKEYIREGKMTGSYCYDQVELGRMSANMALTAVAIGLDGTQLSETPWLSPPASIMDASSLG